MAESAEDICPAETVEEDPDALMSREEERGYHLRLTNAREAMQKLIDQLKNCVTVEHVADRKILETLQSIPSADLEQFWRHIKERSTSIIRNVIKDLSQQELCLKDAEIAALVREASVNINEYESCKQTLSLAHPRYIASVTKKFMAKHNISKRKAWNEYLNEANVGMLLAIERWDIEYGTRLITYATEWMERCMANHKSITRPGFVIQRNDDFDAWKIETHVSKTKEAGGDISFTEGAQELGFSDNRSRGLNGQKACISLYKSSEEPHALLGSTPNKKDEGVSLAAEQNELAMSILEAANLTPLERKAFLLSARDNMYSPAELGQELQESAARARSALHKARRKIQIAVRKSIKAAESFEEESA